MRYDTLLIPSLSWSESEHFANTLVLVLKTIKTVG